MKFKITALLLIILTQFAYGQNRNISNGVVFDGEPYLAVNPNNFRQMVVAWMGYTFQNRIMIKTRVSMDGGKSWSLPQNTPHVSPGYTSADPSVAFDQNGNIFLSFIDYDPDFTSGAVYLWKSTDGGLTWNDPVMVIDIDADPGKLPIDRPWISIDHSGGANDGNIYITTVNASGAEGPPYHPYFIRSTDNGTSFDSWRYADTTGWLAGSLIRKPMATPVVSGDGTFHCVYPAYVLSQGLLPKFILASSSDAGTSFAHKVVYASGTEVSVSDTSAKKGYLLRTNPANPDHLAFLNLSNENGDADVYFRESLDAGYNWSEGLRINDDPPGNGRMQDLVWAGFDYDGDLAVTWRDRRNAADTGYAASYEIYCATRLKESNGFSPNFSISDASIPFDEVLFENGNDFMCVELFDDTLSIVWGDTRNGKLNIWFQRATLNGILLPVQQIAEELIPGASIVQTDLNTLWVRSVRIFRIQIYDSSGSGILDSGKLPGADMEAVDITGFPEGIYIVKVYLESGPVTLKTIITRMN